MHILILGELSLDIVSKSVFHVFTTLFSFQSLLFESQLGALVPSKHSVSIAQPNTPLNYHTSVDVVLIHFKTAAAPRAYEVADAFRKENKIVVLCGTHPSALPQEAAAHADSIIVGVAEKIWPQVIADLENHQLQPMYYSTTCSSYPRLPTTRDVPSDGLRLIMPLEATRGCPQQCSFCQYANIPDGNHFFTRAISDMVEEIQAFPQKILYFKDLSLTINPSYTKQLFTAIGPLNKKFICHGNINVLAHDDDLVTKAHDAGCIEWIIGFESFSQTILAHINKSSNRITDFHRVVENLHDHDMTVDGTFMFGFDEDTPDVFQKTLDNLHALRLDSAIFAVLTPYPGTPMFTKFKSENRILTYDWSKYNRKNVVFEPKNMTKEQLEEGISMVSDAYNTFPNLIKRITHSFTFGFYPGIVTIGSNIGSCLARVNK